MTELNPQAEAVHPQVVAIVQVRMDSSRLPNKAVLPLAGREALLHINDRLEQTRTIDNIVFATTAAKSNQPIVELCQRHGVDLFEYTGDEDDLLGRYISCGELHGADVIVMVDGDCPLLHPETVDRMVQSLLADPSTEYARLDPRSIEGGVAVLRLTTFQKMAQLANESSHRENATLYLMENPAQFSIVDVPCDTAFQDIEHRLWLDTPSDYQFLNEVYRRLWHPGAIVDLKDVVKLIHDEPQIATINAPAQEKSVRAQNDGPVLCPDHARYLPSAIKLALALNERFGVSVRIYSPDMTSADRRMLNQAGILSLELIHDDDQTQVRIGAGKGFEIQAIGGYGAARLWIGEDECAPEGQAWRWLGAYLGYTEGISGRDLAPAESGKSELVLVDCPLCASGERVDIWQHGDGVTNSVCQACGHAYLSRRPSAAAISAAYVNYSQAHTAEFLLDSAGPLWQLARHRRQVLEDVVGQPTSVLEVGAGYGHFLNQFSTSVRRVGIEPSRDQSAFGRHHFGLSEVWNCEFSRLSPIPDSWPAPGFNAVCSFHVLEHVADPAQMLAFMRGAVGPGGFIQLAVPNLHTLSPDLIELSYLHRGLHLHTFSPERVQALLEAVGFTVVYCQEEPENPMLRSSILLVARLSEPRLASGIDIGRQNQALASFHQRLEKRLAALRQAFAEWESAGETVVIYGAGVHTRALLELTSIRCAAIKMLIDDDPEKQGKTMNGVPIGNLQQALAAKPQHLLVSSLSAEAILLERLSQELPDSVQLSGIYNNFSEQD